MKKLSGFLELLNGPLKLLSQNGKLMAFTATIYLVLYLISTILYTSSTQPLVVDFVQKLFSLASVHPGTPEYNELLIAIREDIGCFLGLEGAYMVFYFLFIVFTQTTVNIISSCHYSGHDLSLKELILKVSRTWTRPFVTAFYIQLLSLGYIIFYFLPFMVPSLILYDHPTIRNIVLVILAVIFIVFYLYLDVFWALAIVVSVVEDTYGLSALGKARELVKGKRTHGFLLNLFYILVVLVITIVGMKPSTTMPIVVMVIEFVFLGVASMFMFMAYSVFYFQCKENAKISGGSVYMQIPAAPVVGEDLP